MIASDPIKSLLNNLARRRPSTYALHRIGGDIADRADVANLATGAGNLRHRACHIILVECGIGRKTSDERLTIVDFGLPFVRMANRRGPAIVDHAAERMAMKATSFHMSVP
jgi:hypothetical protein